MQLRSWESIERRIARAAAAFALAAGALTAPAFAQCDPAVLSHAGGRPLTLVARDDTAYVAYHGDLRIIDVSNPTAPALLGTALVPGAAQRIDLGQTHLGMACGDGGLVIVDISNPAAPVVRSVVQMDYAADVAVSNQKAFVVDSTDLKIVDISAPASPIVYSIPQYPTFGFADAVASSGNTLYLAGSADIEILNTATPATPSLLGTYSPAVSASRMIHRSGVLIISGYGGVELVDVSNPASPTLLSLILTENSIHEFAVEEDGGTTMLYFEDEYCEVEAYDITNPAVPILRSFIDACASDLDANGDDLFFINGSGISAIDYSTPTLPSVVHTAERLPNFPRGVAVVGALPAHAIVVDREQLMVYNAADPAAPTLVTTTPLGAFGQDLAVVGTTAFIPQGVNPGGTGLLEIFDLSTPTAPSLVGSIATPDTLLDIAVAGDLACATTIDGSLQIIDVSNPAAPFLRGSLPIGGSNVRDVAIRGDHAFVSDFATGVHTIDISDPDAPALIATIAARTGEYIDGFAMRDRFAAVAQSDNIVDIYDMADPVNPDRIAGFTASPYVTSLAFVDSLLLVSSGPTALHFVDAADPANPTLIASVATGGFPDEFAVRAGALWTTGITGGLYSIALPREPRITIFPQPVSICPGDDAAFSVFGFSATGPTTFQWRRNGVNLVDGPTASGAVIAGATTLNLTITDPALAELGAYDCVVTNPCGSVTTADALLSAALPPIVLQQPQDAVTCPAGQATFTLAGIGTIPFTYQWEAESPLGSGTFVPLTDGVTARFIIDGATTRTLTIAANNGNPFHPAIATNYRCVVTNQCDTITTDAAALIICTVDLDCNDAVDVFDLLDYLDLWFPAAPAADIDGAPGVDVFDLLAYLDDWFAGC